MLRFARAIHAIFILCTLYLVYCGICSHGPIEMDLACSFTSNVASAAQSDLDHLLSMPFDVSDLSGMGRRFSAFSALIESTSSCCSISPAPLLYALDEQFPWMNPSHLQYTPWSSQRHQRRQTTGIVISVGTADFAFAYRLIRTLRNELNSTLPIEVAYAGEPDLSYRGREILQGLGPNIELVNLLQYFDNAIIGLSDGGFATKPFAMLASRFEKVILVDTDVVFLRAPDHLFQNDAGLKDTGTLFWHDRAYAHQGKFSRRDWIEGMLRGQNPSSALRSSPFWKHDLWEHMDSGVVCLDKSRSNVFANLLFTVWMNTKEVREGLIYGHLHGMPPPTSP